MLANTHRRRATGTEKISVEGVTLDSGLHTRFGTIGRRPIGAVKAVVHRHPVSKFAETSLFKSQLTHHPERPLHKFFVMWFAVIQHGF